MQACTKRARIYTCALSVHSMNPTIPHKAGPDRARACKPLKPFDCQQSSKAHARCYPAGPSVQAYAKRDRIYTCVLAVLSILYPSMLCMK